MVRYGIRTEREGREAVIDRAEKWELRSEGGGCGKGFKVDGVVVVKMLRWGEEGSSWRDFEAILW